MQNKKTINVEGKRMNKLEEIVRLLQKLNEDFYTEEERIKEGYPIEICLSADGSGTIEHRQIFPFVVYPFCDSMELEAFLKGNHREQFFMSRNKMEDERRSSNGRP
jgi:hypothetical protein